MTALLFTVAAGAGSLLRWQAGRLLTRPVATLAVNVVGAFALGLLSAASDPVATVIGVGGLGALTTVSTLADDIRNLWSDSTAKAIAYVAITLILGLGAATAGLALLR
jgi:CrcB protein